MATRHLFRLSDILGGRAATRGLVKQLPRQLFCGWLQLAAQLFSSFDELAAPLAALLVSDIPQLNEGVTP
jgi:hypothetical protein